MNAKERLQALEAALRTRGVVDVKFFFSKGADTKLSDVAADVVEVLEAVVAKRVTRFAGIGDSVRA